MSNGQVIHTDLLEIPIFDLTDSTDAQVCEMVSEIVEYTEGCRMNRGLTNIAEVDGRTRDCRIYL